MRAIGILACLAGFLGAYKMAFGAGSWAALIFWWLLAMCCFSLLGTVAFGNWKVARSNKPRHVGFSIWV
jgi:hypothetical protein